MNERIKRILEQADISMSMTEFSGCLKGQNYLVSDSNLSEMQLEKFAELIVRECADQCDLLLDRKMSSEWTRGTHDCSKAIKKHFGV